MGEATTVIRVELVRVSWASLAALLLALPGPAPRAVAQKPSPPTDPGAADAQDTHAPPAAQAKPTRPPPRKAIKGIGSVRSLSRLTFPSQPNSPYQLEATYVFPQRARWRLAPFKPASEKPNAAQAKRAAAADRAARRLQYRSGDRVWTMAPGKTTSEAYTLDEKRKTLLQFELRRVAMIWPAELDWSSEGNLRRAELPEVGLLEAELSPQTGRVLRLSSSDADGTPRETLAKIVWGEAADKARRWPTSWQLEVGGAVIWTEMFSTVRPGLKFNDQYFVPHDRRGSQGTQVQSGDNVQRIEVPQVAVWRQDLSPEALKDWDVALKEAREAIARWVPVFDGSPIELDLRPCFLLGDNGLPNRLELHLTSLPERPPPGWFSQGGFEALRLVMIGVEALDSTQLRTMRAHMPAGHHAGGPWIVVQLTEDGVGLTQVILPAHKDLR